MTKAKNLSVAVIAASLGRPGNLALLLRTLARQTHLPDQVILSLESERDAPPLQDLPFETVVTYGPRGTCAQRNRGLNLLKPGTDIVVFYDDDFVPSKHSLAGLSAFFAANPAVNGATGIVVADGINGPGLSAAQAMQIVEAEEAKGAPAIGHTLELTRELYGCNMCYRLSALNGIRFDETLPLYGWYEDIDFGARVPGTLVRTDAFSGVHCGEKRGRETSGKRLGYSQIANPTYLLRKGTLSFADTAACISRVFCANHLHLLRPEAWIDRRARSAGNWAAIADLIRGKIHPQRILDIPAARRR